MELIRLWIVEALSSRRSISFLYLHMARLWIVVEVHSSRRSISLLDIHTMDLIVNELRFNLLGLRSL